MTARRKRKARRLAPALDHEARRRVQSALAAQGFDPRRPDGKFGPKTRGAIQAWQQANGHAATGELTGEQAERLLAAETAETPPGSTGTAAIGKPHGSIVFSQTEFSCTGGQGRLEELKWDVQNYQEYSQEYKASTHLLLAYCQMALGDPRGALENFQVASDMGRIIANYFLADYYLTGGQGQDEAKKNLEIALWEFEKTLQKINAVGADYPNTKRMAGDEIYTSIYPNTLLALIEQGPNRYMAEGYDFCAETPPTYYDSPAKAIQRNQANKDMLDRVEYHIDSCLADHEGQNMMFRARRFADAIPDFENKLIEYKKFYFKVKEGYCPLYQEGLTEVRKMEEKIFAIALHCSLPSQTPTEQRPPCSDIKIQTEEFATYLVEDWGPRKQVIRGN